MTAYIYIFTYDRDIDLLQYCLKALTVAKNKLPEEDKMVVTVVNDLYTGKSDLNEERALFMGADRYLESKFYRKGNLNGVACIEGMLKTYIDNTPDDADYIMQLDADCLFQDFDWVRAAGDMKINLAGQVIGYDRNVKAKIAATGPGLLMRKAFAKRLLNILQNQSIRERIDKGPGYSDIIFNMLADMLRVPCARFEYYDAQPRREGGRKIRVAQYYILHGRTNEEFLRESCIIHFDRKNVHDSHEYVLKGMKEWFEKEIDQAS